MIEPMLTDLAEAVRRPSAAEQLAARVAGHAHCPVLLRTLHIGGANLTTCDSPVLPRSPTDVPSPSGQWVCVIHPDHCCKLKRKPFVTFGAVNLDQIAAITTGMHARAS